MDDRKFYFFETENIYDDVVSYVLEDSFDAGEDHAVTIHKYTAGGKTQVIRTRLYKVLFFKSKETGGWRSDDFTVAIQEELVDSLVPISRNKSKLPAGYNFIEAP